MPMHGKLNRRILMLLVVSKDFTFTSTYFYDIQASAYDFLCRDWVVYLCDLHVLWWSLPIDTLWTCNCTGYLISSFVKNRDHLKSSFSYYFHHLLKWNTDNSQATGGLFGRWESGVPFWEKLEFWFLREFLKKDIDGRLRHARQDNSKGTF